MSAPAWATDLTDILLDPSATTNWSALGGGAAGLNAESDYYVQGGGSPSCISKNAWTNALKGMIYVPGGSWTIPTDGVIMAWIIYQAPPSLDSKANGGLRIIVGSGSGDYDHFYFGGNDTLIFETWQPIVVDPNNATPDATDGTPSGTEAALGCLAYLPTTAGPTKGSPLAIDALRYGRHTLQYTLGDSGAGGPNTFALAEATANSLANRWGNIEFNKGAYYVQGFHSLGTSGTAVYFVDSNKVLFVRAAGANNLTNDAVSTGYNRFEILNSGSDVSWDNLIFRALGTRARGVFVHTAGAFAVTSCQFIDVDTFSLLAASVMTDCIFRRTNAITAPGSDLTGSQVLTPTIGTDASAVVWDVATDPDGLLDDMRFSKGSNDHHAIEFGTSSPLTMALRGIDFSGFTNTIGHNAAPLYIKRTSGTVTISLYDCTGVTVNGYKSDGATVVIVPGAVTVSVHAIDAVDFSDVVGARVLLYADSGGDLFSGASVSIERSGTTATVTHSSHGLTSGKKVLIQGANEQQYNGIFTITVTDSSHYTYTVDDSPSTPAGGSPTATYVILDGDTDANGVVQDPTFIYTSDQPIVGRVRKGTASTLYKTTPLPGQIESTGYAATAVMVRDE